MYPLNVMSSFMPRVEWSTCRIARVAASTVTKSARVAESRVAESRATKVAAE